MIFSIRITIAIYFASPASATVYFGNDFIRAEQQIHSYDSLFTEVAATYQQDADILKAIVFPEFIRYSYLSDFMESFALEQVYTGHGHTYADFSIGECQMKPSFAEDMEKLGAAQTGFTGLNTSPTPGARKERLQRMKDITWQLKYLALFVKIAGDKFHLNTFSKQEKVRMLATIYNRGIHTPVTRLPALCRQRCFPHGKKAGNQNPYVYSDIALLFLKRNAERI